MIAKILGFVLPRLLLSAPSVTLYMLFGETVCACVGGYNIYPMMNMDVQRSLNPRVNWFPIPHALQCTVTRILGLTMFKEGCPIRGDQKPVVLGAKVYAVITGFQRAISSSWPITESFSGNKHGCCELRELLSPVVLAPRDKDTTDAFYRHLKYVPGCGTWDMQG